MPKGRKEEHVLNAHDLITLVGSGYSSDEVIEEALRADLFEDQNYSFQPLVEDEDEDEESDDEEDSEEDNEQD